MIVKRGNGMTKRIKSISIDKQMVIITWADSSMTTYCHEEALDREAKVNV